MVERRGVLNSKMSHRPNAENMVNIDGESLLTEETVTKAMLGLMDSIDTRRNVADRVPRRGRTDTDSDTNQQVGF